MAGRRERWGVIGAVLSAIEEESGRGGEARPTAIATRANIAYDRLQDYMDELQAKGLVAGTPPRLTAAGRELLSQYRRWLEVLTRYGFAPGEDAQRSVRMIRNDHTPAAADHGR